MLLCCAAQRVDVRGRKSRGVVDVQGWMPLSAFLSPANTSHSAIHGNDSSGSSNRSSIGSNEEDGSGDQCSCVRRLVVVVIGATSQERQESRETCPWIPSSRSGDNSNDSSLECVCVFIRIRGRVNPFARWIRFTLQAWPVSRVRCGRGLPQRTLEAQRGTDWRRQEAAPRTTRCRRILGVIDTAGAQAPRSRDCKSRQRPRNSMEVPSWSGSVALLVAAWPLESVSCIPYPNLPCSSFRRHVTTRLSLPCRRGMAE